MPQQRDRDALRHHDAPPRPNAPESASSRENPGHLIRGAADYEDVLDRLSKGVSVPSDVTNVGNSTDKA
jgi:hypothetical protein